MQDLKTSLSNQEEVNHQLQKYIDSVILNIMEKHPELLEVTKQGNKKWVMKGVLTTNPRLWYKNAKNKILPILKSFIIQM